jgi:hypothetical protein
MGKPAILAALWLAASGGAALTAGCATELPPGQAVAPSLPPATYHQLMILDGARTVTTFPAAATPRPCCPAPHPATPCVLDVQAALLATPEVRECRARGYADDAAEYHVLIHRANERLRNAIRQVAFRHGFDLVLERGSVVLRPEIVDASIADITPEVTSLVSRQ